MRRFGLLECNPIEVFQVLAVGRKIPALALLNGAVVEGETVCGYFVPSKQVEKNAVLWVKSRNLTLDNENLAFKSLMI